MAVPAPAATETSTFEFAPGDCLPAAGGDGQHADHFAMRRQWDAGNLLEPGFHHCLAGDTLILFEVVADDRLSFVWAAWPTIPSPIL